MKRKAIAVRILIMLSDRKTGSVAILVAWVLLFLSMLAVAIAAHVSANLSTARLLEQRAASQYAAQAGVVSATAIVLTDTNDWDALTEIWHGKKYYFENITIGEGVFSVASSWPCAGSRGQEAEFGLADEEGKVDVNAVTNAAARGIVRSLLERVGGLDREHAVEVADCISDWVDTDDQLREKGAEDGYYAGRSPRYSCRNGPVARREELVLIKGMNSKIVAKIRRYVTTHGSGGSVNLNTADPVVLAVLAGASGAAEPSDCEALAQRILAFREGGGVFTRIHKRELKRVLFGKGRLGEGGKKEWRLLEWLINHGMVGVKSRHFSGISVGRSLRHSGAERQIHFVYDRKKDAIRAWHEQ